MALTTRLGVDLRATYTDPLDLSTAVDPLEILKRVDLATGNGAGQADLLWHDRRTLASEDDEDLDLAASLTDAFGNTLTIGHLKLIMVTAAAANTHNVIVTSDDSAGVPLFAGLGDGIAVRPGGLFLWAATDATAVAVAATTGDLLNFENSGAGSTVTYDVVIIGAS